MCRAGRLWPTVHNHQWEADISEAESWPVSCRCRRNQTFCRSQCIGTHWTRPCWTVHSTLVSVHDVEVKQWLYNITNNIKKLCVHFRTKMTMKTLFWQKIYCALCCINYVVADIESVKVLAICSVHCILTVTRRKLFWGPVAIVTQLSIEILNCTVIEGNCWGTRPPTKVNGWYWRLIECGISDAVAHCTSIWNIWSAKAYSAAKATNSWWNQLCGTVGIIMFSYRDQKTDS